LISDNTVRDYLVGYLEGSNGRIGLGASPEQ
jgi:hypothetical protein